MENQEIGYFLYELHLFALVAFVIIYYMRPAIRIYLLIGFFPLFLMHLLGLGCPYTRLERYYHGQDITIIDPFLNFFGIYPSYDNRKNFQAWFSSILVAWMLFFLYFK
ncbi:hypothetical protein EB118_02835 [bacterium]|nr:hypothetical protein [Actinomycetota bacterium]NDG29019.1 hypothetical protein [bacterium]